MWQQVFCVSRCCQLKCHTKPHEQGVKLEQYLKYWVERKVSVFSKWKVSNFLNTFTIFNQLYNFHCLLLLSPNVSRAFQFQPCKNFLVCLHHLFENAKTSRSTQYFSCLVAHWLKSYTFFVIELAQKQIMFPAFHSTVFPDSSWYCIEESVWFLIKWTNWSSCYSTIFKRIVVHCTTSWIARVQFLAEAGMFSLPLLLDWLWGWWAYSVCTLCISLGVKWPELETDLAPCMTVFFSNESCLCQCIQLVADRRPVFYCYLLDIYLCLLHTHHNQSIVTFC
jgi:hypothetical protein